MARVIGTNISTIREKDEEKPNYGGWTSVQQTRKRKGVIPNSGLYNSDSKFLTETRPERFLTDAELWNVYRRTADVRSCIDSIVRRVATFDWTIRPTVDPKSDYYLEAVEIAKRANRFLSAPNRNGDTWQDVMTAVLTDLLVYDAGAIELAHDSRGKLQELVPLRGSSIRPVMNKHGRLIKYTQETMLGGIDNLTGHSIEAADQPEFKPTELVYFQLFPNTASAGYGNPLIEAIVNEVVILLRSSEHLMMAYDADEIPPGILVLAGIAGNAAREARADFQNLKGQDTKIRVLTTPDPSGAGAKWVELQRTPKDLDFQTLVEQVRRVVWRVFGVMPVEMGASDEMPRATAQVQIDVSSSHLVTPMLEMLQAKINTRILPLVVGDSEAAQLVKFAFDRGMRPNAEEAQLISQKYQRLVGIGVMTRNEVRKEMGLLPIFNGDIPTVDTAQGPLPLDILVVEGPVGGLVIEPPDIVPDSGVVSVDNIDEGEAPGEIVVKDAFERIAFKDLPSKVQKALKKKAEEHNEEVGADKRKRTTSATLGNVYDRGVGAYHTNPQSVRPNVTSAEQWAYARVNSFLYVLKNLKFKGGKHDTDLLPKSHPLHSKEKSAFENAVGDVDPTNFPKAGDDKKVSLRNSEYEVFDVSYAQKLKEGYPEIWKKGGNIEGNNQYRRLVPIAKRGGVVETETEEMAVRKREAWAARHLKDYRLAGVVAQIKWLAVGSRGEKYMKDLINEQKKKYKSGLHHDCSGGSCDHQSHDTTRPTYERSAYEKYLPSEWQKNSKFSDVRTMDLSSLGWSTINYTKSVIPFWVEARDSASAIIAAHYKDGSISQDAAPLVHQELSKVIEKLIMQWSIVTKPLYREAAQIAKQATVRYTGQDLIENWDQRADLYAQEAMFYLSNPEGMLGVVKTELMLMVDSLTRGKDLSEMETRADPKQPEVQTPKGAEAGIAVKSAVEITAKVFDSNEYRIANWSGKLVELANQLMQDGVIGSSTSVDEEGRVEWYYEWVAVGDARTCPTCIIEGSSGFRPLATASVRPGGATQCGARCRCVLVLWTKAEIDRGVAESLSPNQ